MDTVPQEFFYQEDLNYQLEQIEAPGLLCAKMDVYVFSAVYFHLPGIYNIYLLNIYVSIKILLILGYLAINTITIDVCS